MGGGGEDGGQKVFHDFRSETSNVTFFGEVDYRLRYMNDKGIVCGLALAHAIGAESWSSFASPEARLRYARYIVARYSAYGVAFIVAIGWV